MFFYSINPVDEYSVFEEDRSNSRKLAGQFLQELLSTLKNHLFSPRSISGIYFFHESGDE